MSLEQEPEFCDIHDFLRREVAHEGPALRNTVIHPSPPSRASAVRIGTGRD